MNRSFVQTPFQEYYVQADPIAGLPLRTVMVSGQLSSSTAAGATSSFVLFTPTFQVVGAPGVYPVSVVLATCILRPTVPVFVFCCVFFFSSFWTLLVVRSFEWSAHTR